MCVARNVARFVMILVLSGAAVNAVAQTKKTTKPTKVGPE